jgi:hypothetical protein
MGEILKMNSFYFCANCHSSSFILCDAYLAHAIGNELMRSQIFCVLGSSLFGKLLTLPGDPLILAGLRMKMGATLDH